MAEEFSLEAIRRACEDQGVTLQVLVQTLDEARTQAEVFNKAGDVLPDHGTRLKATLALCDLLQLRVLTKAQAQREGALGPIKNITEVVEDRLKKRLDHAPRAA